jgi:uncharacterized protein YaiI (UPF0178 family)
LAPVASTTQIYVDADACPVKDEIRRVAGGTRSLRTWLQSRVPHVGTSADPGNAGRRQFDEADNWIVSTWRRAISSSLGDIQLADRCLKAGAQVLGHGRQPFTHSAASAALAMRELSSQLRDMRDQGRRAGLPQKDRTQFLNALEQAVQRAPRQKLDVHQDVDELAERVAHVEAAHAPGFVGGAVFDPDLRLLHALQRFIDIVDLDREIGHRRA